MAGIEFFEIEKIEVAEFHELPDGQGPPSQVHLTLTLAGFPHPLIMRFKSRPTLDELIVNLIRHGLSRECPRHEGQPHTPHAELDGSRCTDGRVPNVTVFGLLDALRGMDADYVLGPRTINLFPGRSTAKQMRQWPWTTEAELIEALTRALAAAVQAEGSAE